ncbi:MAG: hypothetical protein RL099_1488 [Bacteroidota bacterium]|jgi:hypothetical protein
MNSENNLLPPFVIASLYKNELVVIDTQKISNEDNPKKKEAIATTPVDVQKPISFLGDNLKKVTILLQDTTAVHLADESLQFLTAILAACKLNMGDVAIVNTVHQPVQYTQIKTELKPSTIILFNISAAAIALPFEVPQYQVQQYDNCTLLFSAPLHSMLVKTEAAKLEKGKLWNALKKTFNI